MVTVATFDTCDVCGSTVKGLFPTDMPGPLQYGNGLKAYLINLMVGQMMPLARTRSLTESLLGERLSESTLLNAMARLCIPGPLANGGNWPSPRPITYGSASSGIKHAVLLFAREPHIAFTRMANVKQKVSCCFRTVHYAPKLIAEYPATFKPWPIRAIKGVGTYVRGE